MNNKNDSQTYCNKTNNLFKQKITKQKMTKTLNFINLSEIMSEKELLKIQLFQSVKKIKGDFYFKSFYQKSKFIEININQPQQNRQSKWQQLVNQKRYFLYILSGQVNMYKQTLKQNKIYPKNNFNQFKQQIKSEKKQIRNIKSSNKDKIIIKNTQTNNKQPIIIKNKCYLRSYIANQCFGYQEYPLYLNQNLKIEFISSTKMIIFPLQYFYKVFSNVISLVNIQITAQFLKKVSLFRQIQMQKLLRLSTFSQRIRTYENDIIIKQGDQISNIFLLYEGRIIISNSQQYYEQNTNGFIIGKKQIDLGSKKSLYSIKSIIQCELIVIPLNQFTKNFQLKQKLKQAFFQDQRQLIKSRGKIHSNLSEYSKNQQNNQVKQKNKKQKFCPYNSKHSQFYDNYKSKTLTFQNKSQNSIDFQRMSNKLVRPKTSFNTLGRLNEKNLVYNLDGRHSYLNTSIDQTMRKISTSMNNYKSQQKYLNKKDIDLSNITMGQLFFSKFIQRKQKIENKQVTNFIKSLIPESIININKQYSIIKPLHQKKSNYIKNYKRKIKQAHRHKNKSINIDQFDQNQFNINQNYKIIREKITKNKIQKSQIQFLVQNKKKQNCIEQQKNKQFLVDEFTIKQTQL